MITPRFSKHDCKPDRFCSVFLFATATLLYLVTPADSTADVSFTLASFSNPENKLEDGSPCNQNACQIKIAFDFQEPIALSFITAEATTNTITFSTGPSAISTHNGLKYPNPFPSDPSTDKAIKKLLFDIRVFDYSFDKLEKVATFSVDEDVKFQTQVYNLTSGYSTFILSSDINCHADYYKDCTVYCVEGASYTCDPITGQKVCKTGWSGQDCLTKVTVPCSVQPVPNGSYAPQSASYSTSDVVTVSCKLGYIPASTSLTCQSDGQWSPAWPVCSIAECAPLDSLDHGTVSPDSATSSPSPYQTAISFSCDSGYNLSGQSTTTCRSDATWDNPQPTCDEIRCPPLTISAFVTVSPANKDFSTSAVGETVGFFCVSGYTLKGSLSLTCLASGDWDGTEPVCELLMCPDVRRNSIPGGMSFYSSNPPPRTPDNVLYQSCMNGYVRKGPLTRTCRRNGTWDGSDDFTCLKECSKITGFEGGRVIYTSDTPAEGTTASFACSHGAFLEGSRETVCQADGTWNLTGIPSCVSGCKIPDSVPSNVTISPNSYHSDVILAGYTLTFSCPKSCFLSSQPQTSCLQNGEWNNSFPSCIPFVENIDATIKELYVAGISTISGVFAVFIVTVFTLAYFDRKLTKKSKSTTRKLSYAIQPNGWNTQNSLKMHHVVSPAARLPPINSLGNKSAAQVNQSSGQNNDGGSIKKFAYKNPAFVKDDF